MVLTDIETAHAATKAGARLWSNSKLNVRITVQLSLTVTGADHEKARRTCKKQICDMQDKNRKYVYKKNRNY